MIKYLFSKIMINFLSDFEQERPACQPWSLVPILCVLVGLMTLIAIAFLYSGFYRVSLANQRIGFNIVLFFIPSLLIIVCCPNNILLCGSIAKKYIQYFKVFIQESFIFHQLSTPFQYILRSNITK